jgi:replicative DNA helicase
MKPTIPQNQKAEAAAIGCLLYGASINSVPLIEAHFHGADHRLIFAVVADLAERQHPVNISTVRSELESRGELESAGGDPSRFLSEIEPIGGDSLLAFHFTHLEAARQRREAFLFCHQHMPDMVDGTTPPSEFAEALGAACAPMGANAGSDMASIVTEIDERMASGTPDEAFPFGFAPLDRHLGGGLHRGELAVIAADTGYGKSALMIQSAAACAAAGHPVVYFSLEMNRADVCKRIASASGRASQNSPQFRSAMFQAMTLPITIHDDTCDLLEIMAEVRSASKARKCPVAMVDYLQIVDYKADNREQMLSEITRKLKNLAQTEGIAIITASQVNENGALRESRAIGHHANLVLFITADGEPGDDGTLPPLEMTVAKFRRGARTKFKHLYLHGPHSRFEMLHPERAETAA